MFFDALVSEAMEAGVVEVGMGGSWDATNVICNVFFFFQAEDGIRDGRVTGVQTCALPIFGLSRDGEAQYRQATDQRDRIQSRVQGGAVGAGGEGDRQLTE